MSRRASFAFATLLALAACSAPDASSYTPVQAPDASQFPPVAAMLERRCGTLDCHGSRDRNFRMWGQEGMRLALGDIPGGTQTSGDEVTATYDSLVALEPEILSAVVADHGQNPERLTLVRKARGLEKHDGGAIFTPNDVRDRCLLSWLEGATDDASCSQALLLP